MDAHFVLADSYAQSNRHDLAFSALPDAPVLPYVAPRHRLRGITLAVARGSNRLPRLRHGPRPSEACPL
jgi:hypothetical protein